MSVVLLPPVGNDADTWQWIAHDIGQRHQFPGFGRPRAEVPPTMASLADEVVDTYGGPLHLIGVSMGGMVALNAAVRHPDRVASVLVACTGARADPQRMLARAEAAEGGMTGVLDTTMERWFTPEALEPPLHQGAAYARRTLLALDASAFADGWRAIATHDVVDRLHELSMPITAVAGGRDTASPVSRSEEIVERAPNSRLVVLDDAPHMVQLETPDEFSRVLAEHLAPLV